MTTGADVDNGFCVLYDLCMRVSVLSCLAWISAVTTALSLDTPPKAAARAVEDDYFGVKISDPYGWLENIEEMGWKICGIRDFSPGLGKCRNPGS